MAHITDVLKKPVLTEKSMTLSTEENKYTFDVDVNANKIEIKQAVEAMFGVKVESVNVMNVKPKKKRMGRYEGKTNRRRKAIVKLAEGESINYFGEE
ncbi:MAG TPA: 50S ribosomal protein L23 [Candidatus Erysipelatoclostridium merdavium]|uniref:Large ribosomal subunit protein uL23 n=1 Tax=Candidatus Erysipelatoclostridium merdavium TaxID=2838566 RepID=A0A9D1XLX4_9FIRM|nr:50S ribosomal protein L23 [Candidatus Erysipelatoclostridium merdavium]